MEQINKEMHLVFPKEYMDTITDALEQEDYVVISKDYEFSTFYHWMTSDEPSNANVALIVDSIEDDVPVDVKAQEYIEKLTEVRLARPHLRLIINLPTSFKHLISMQKRLLSLSIYDLYFEENFSVKDILSWIENPKTLFDLKSLVLDDQTIINESLQDDLTGKQNNIAANESPAVIEEYRSSNDVNDNENSLSSKMNHVFGDKIRDFKRFTNSFSTDSSSHPGIKEKTRVVEKHIIMTQQSIAVLSLSKGAGSTFHCLNYAAYLRDHGMDIGIYEQPVHVDGRSYVADAFDVFKNDNDSTVSVPHCVIEKKPVMLENTFKYQDIAIYATDYGKSFIQDFQKDHFFKYLNVGKHTIKLMDYGYVPTQWFSDASFMDTLDTFDQIVVVVDLLPTSFIPNFDRLLSFQRLEEGKAEKEVHYILNKFNTRVPNKELKQLALFDAHRSPSFSLDDVYESLFKKKIPYDISREIQEGLGTIYQNLYSDMGIQTETKFKRRKGFRNPFIKS